MENTTEQAVLAPVYALLEGMAQKSKAQMMQQVLPTGVAANWRAGSLRHLQFETLFDRLLEFHANDEISEPLTDPVVHIGNHVAAVWAPYEFFLNGQLHHSGTNVFNLLKLDGRWVIVGLADDSQLAGDRPGL